jgi:hypothetical protein
MGQLIVLKDTFLFFPKKYAKKSIKGRQKLIIKAYPSYRWVLFGFFDSFFPNNNTRLYSFLLLPVSFIPQMMQVIIKRKFSVWINRN